MSKIPKRLVGANRLIPVLRAGAMHEDESGERAIGFGKRQRARQAKQAFANRHFLFIELRGVGVGRAFVFPRKSKEESRDLVYRRENNLDIKRPPLELTGHNRLVLLNRLCSGFSRPL